MVNLAGVFGAALSSIYDPATFHTTALVDDGTGTLTATPTNYACRAQLEAATQWMRSAAGFAETDQRILVLASTLAVAPTTDDEITIAGRRWKIASVSQDPARAYWELRGKRKSG